LELLDIYIYIYTHIFGRGKSALMACNLVFYEVLEQGVSGSRVFDILVLLSCCVSCLRHASQDLRLIQAASGGVGQLTGPEYGWNAGRLEKACDGKVDNHRPLRTCSKHSS
jgi:hypothetical protein